MNPAGTAMTEQPEQTAGMTEPPSTAPTFHANYRRRRIVVRDPKTGQTKILGNSGNGATAHVPSDRETVDRMDGNFGTNHSLPDAEQPYPNNVHLSDAPVDPDSYARRGHPDPFASAPIRYRGDMGGRGSSNSDRSNFHDEGRSPIMKIVSGYRGRQIVVRDPTRRNDGPSQSLGVRGGVRKSSYYDRRNVTRSSPFSDCFDDRPQHSDSVRGGRDYRYDRDVFGNGSMERYDEFNSKKGAPADYDGHAAHYDRDFHHRNYHSPSRMHGHPYQPRDLARKDQHLHMSPEDHSLHASQQHRDIQGSGRGVDVGSYEGEDLSGRVVYVDNLSDDVTTTGLADLFGMVGTVNELRLLYDRQGKPNGSADIIFHRATDAAEAIKSLHNVPLNNRPMRLSMGNCL